MSRIHRGAAHLGVVALLLPTLVACGGDSAGTASTQTDTASASAAASESATPTTSEAPSTAETASTAVTSAGQASITFAGSTESFDLVNCVSGSTTSVQGSGKNATYSFLVDIQDSSGVVTLSNTSDMSVYLDGKPTAVNISADGTFTVSGTYVADGQSDKFNLTGTCGMVNWS